MFVGLLGLALADVTVADTRFQLAPRSAGVAGVGLSIQGYAYAIQQDGRCIGIAIEGPSSASLPTAALEVLTYHDLDQVLWYDTSACALLVERAPLEEEEPDEAEVVVVQSKKRDKSLARLRTSVRDRLEVLHRWGLSPLTLETDQHLAEVRHVDGTGRVEAASTSGWSTLLEDPFQQVEYGSVALVLESARGGSPRVVARRHSRERRGVTVEALTINVATAQNGPVHLLESATRFQVECTLGPCTHLSMLVPAVYEERAIAAEFRGHFALESASVDGVPVTVRAGAFGRSSSHHPTSYTARTLPLDLATGERAVVDLAWSDQLALTHPLVTPVVSMTDSQGLQSLTDWFAERPGPERAYALDIDRPSMVDLQRADFDPTTGSGVKWQEVLDVRRSGMRPRSLAPSFIGQPGAAAVDARLVRNGTGMPVWLHGTDVKRLDPRLHTASSAAGGPWLAAGEYGVPYVESGISLYFVDGFFRSKATEVFQRIRAFHETFSSQLGPRDLDLALFEAPQLGQPRLAYGAMPGMGWLSKRTGVAVLSPIFQHSDDRALMYATAAQWFDRPNATLEPWMQRAFIEVYTDLLFEGVHGAEAAGAWRRHPNPFAQERFADFGINDWSYTEQLAYSTRALELLRLSLGPRAFNTAVRYMLEDDDAVSADRFARSFSTEADARLVRDALIRGICPSVELSWDRHHVRGTTIDVVSDYTAHTWVVPVVVEVKNDDKPEFTHFMKIRDGKGQLTMHPSVNVKKVRLDPYQRLPLCGTSVTER